MNTAPDVRSYYASTVNSPTTYSRLEGEETSAGGIIIPDTAQEKPAEGEVLAVGNGARGEDGVVHPLALKTISRAMARSAPAST